MHYLADLKLLYDIYMGKVGMIKWLVFKSITLMCDSWVILFLYVVMHKTHSIIVWVNSVSVH